MIDLKFMKKLYNKDFSSLFFQKTKSVISKLNFQDIDKLAQALSELRKSKGRIFFIGLGGSAGNASHAVNDFRKICGIECYSPTDNVSELTARINDDGWENSLSSWLKTSRLKKNDALFILSVGGGDSNKNISTNIIKAIKYAKKNKSKVYGIVGRDGGYTKKNGNLVIVIPTEDQKLVTPFAESFQALIWHCLVSNPVLKINPTKW